MSCPHSTSPSASPSSCSQCLQQSGISDIETQSVVVDGARVFVNGVQIERTADPSFMFVYGNGPGNAREADQFTGVGGDRPEDVYDIEKTERIVNTRHGEVKPKCCSVCRHPGHNKMTCPELG